MDTPPAARNVPRRRRVTRSVAAPAINSQSPNCTQQSTPTHAPPPGTSQVSELTPPVSPLHQQHELPVQQSPPMEPTATQSSPHVGPATAPTPPAARPPSSPPAPQRPVAPINGTSIPSTADQPSNNDPPSWVIAWVSRFESTLDEDMLEGVLKDFLALVHQVCNIRGPQRNRRRPQQHSSSTRDQNTATEASEIQRLYRANRKRAFDRVMAGTPRFCQVDSTSVYQHFRGMYENPPSRSPTAVPVTPIAPPTTDNPFDEPFTPTEVAKRLARGHNTAPGPDKIRYLHWRKIDPRGLIISAIFNAVRRTGYIPHNWKSSTTVLIHKKGDVNCLSNWRPICLSNTLGKLYSACLADRLLRWCNDNQRLSTAQKGFLNYQGCLEHNFLLNTIIQDARRTRNDCYIAWMDIANAFGNIPHDTLWTSLRWHGLHQDAISTLQQLYEDSTTCVRTCSGFTNPIAMRSGVKQGCPISPLLFIMAMEPAIRQIQAAGKGYPIHGHHVSILAYADDVALISNSATGLQDLLNTITDWTDWAGIRFNINKCGTLAVLGKLHTAGTNTFNIKQQELPRLAKEDAYKHLGVPTGFSKCDTEEATTNNILTSIEKLNSSKLAPWQKVDALNTFIIPKLTFCLTTGTTPKKTLDRIDRLIKRCIKRWLGLPQRASTEIVHLPYKQGGTNVPPTSHLADIAQICHALYLFQSRDEDIAAISRNALADVVKHRIRRDITTDDLCCYLNGSMQEEFGRPSKDITSVWTRLRMATRRLKKKIELNWTTGPDDLPNIVACDNLIRAQDCQRTLCGLLKVYYHQKLAAKPDQGKAYKLTSASEVSNHFINNGQYTRFSDWYFIHRARLSVVALRGHKRFGNEIKKCRRCSYQRETLAHVLCHCPPNFHLITKRHNAVLNRIVAAFRPRDAKVYVNQRIPGFSENCRPDLVVVHEASKTATIVDVTVPFENGAEAFQTARDEKLRKYNSLVQFFKQQGFNTHISAFVVGALGGYDHSNDSTLQRLGINRRYASLMKKLMISDTIRWSADIYRNHLNSQGRAPYPRPNVPQN
ncbi:uncharacterized protein LOC111626079 [Centruroides sculpturatus]|uniref:uncharacterized protein LOC111626079 n=1 Tax=Centruroides sculpturatus TaxID=218467 RepID=UPI000C6E0803|nr:uncharacterized protein LOC111626079 [Centruroides sculpturatus]